MTTLSVQRLSASPIVEPLTTFKKWLHIEEDYNIVAPITGAIANFCPGEPDILGLIGPSGSIKTEIIRSFGETENKYVYPVSSITEKTLVSGYEESNDLAPRLKHRLLTIKDLTSILSKNKEAHSQIFADFREMSDGYIKKEYGNGITKDYTDIHSSILFACTNAIERYNSMYSNLGQRLIFFRPKNNSTKAMRRARQNTGKELVMRLELGKSTQGFLKEMVDKVKDNGLPQIYEDLESLLEIHCELLALSRTVIQHDFRGEIDEIPEPEYPTRIIKTVGRLCQVYGLIYGQDEVAFEGVDFGARIIMDNIPTKRWVIMSNMTDQWSATGKIADHVRLPPDTTLRILDELTALNIVDRTYALGGIFLYGIVYIKADK